MLIETFLPFLVNLFKTHALNLSVLNIEIFSKCFVFILAVVNIRQRLYSSLFLDLPQLLMVHLAVIIN
jgi:hypothetical protein